MRIACCRLKVSPTSVRLRCTGGGAGGAAAAEDAPPPAFGNIQGSGNVTIGWDPVVADDQGQPITLQSYELRIRLVGAPPYTFIAVPPEFTGHALTLSAGDYEGFVEAIGVSGYIATAATFNLTVN